MVSFKGAVIAVQTSVKRFNRMRTLSFSQLISGLNPNKYHGMERWMVKGVKIKWGSDMFYLLYDLVREPLVIVALASASCVVMLPFSQFGRATRAALSSWRSSFTCWGMTGLLGALVVGLRHGLALLS
jgi:hypothetical protein